MFMKQYNYKPRSNSTSSQGSQSGSPPKDGAADANKTSATLAGAQATGPTAAAAAGRRRSSASDKFAGLNAVKRNSQDAGMADKKASWDDQKTGGSGILGGMWDNFTKK